MQHNEQNCKINHKKLLKNNIVSFKATSLFVAKSFTSFLQHSLFQHESAIAGAHRSIFVTVPIINNEYSKFIKNISNVFTFKHKYGI